jgi:ketosteroid isomerase-like protein
MPPRSAEQTAIAFNDAINARSIDDLERLMTADHRFIDSEGASIDGRVASLDAWDDFFEAFPDYRNHFDLVISIDNQVMIAGSSTCEDERLSGPALWSALVVEGRVAEWRVHDDTPDTRAGLGFI